MKSLLCQVQHDRGVLADGIQHYRFFTFGDDLPQYMDTLRLEALDVSQSCRHVGSWLAEDSNGWPKITRHLGARRRAVAMRFEYGRYARMFRLSLDALTPR